MKKVIEKTIDKVMWKLGYMRISDHDKIVAELISDRDHTVKSWSEFFTRKVEENDRLWRALDDAQKKTMQKWYMDNYGLFRLDLNSKEA